MWTHGEIALDYSIHLNAQEPPIRGVNLIGHASPSFGRMLFLQGDAPQKQPLFWDGSPNQSALLIGYRKRALQTHIWNESGDKKIWSGRHGPACLYEGTKQGSFPYYDRVPQFWTSHRTRHVYTLAGTRDKARHQSATRLEIQADGCGKGVSLSGHTNPSFGRLLFLRGDPPKAISFMGWELKSISDNNCQAWYYQILGWQASSQLHQTGDRPLQDS